MSTTPAIIIPHDPAVDVDGLPTRVAVERARLLLAHAHDLHDIKAIHDKAKAMEAYASALGNAREAQRNAATIVLLAERRIGQALDELPAAPPSARGQGRRKADVESPRAERVDSPRAAAMRELGMTPSDASRCRKLGAVPQEVFDRHIAQVAAKGEKVTRSGVIAAVSDAADYDSDDWGTPPDIVEAVRRIFDGEIDLDPATNERAQRVVKARKFYTVADNGLERTWKGRVFLNPPYSSPLVSQFVEKFITEAQSGRMTKGIILLNASTDTQWFHDLAARFPALFTRGRLAFIDPRGNPIEGNRVGQVFFAAGCGRVFKSVLEPAVGLVLQRAA